jgi:hypothetical protein
LLIAIESSHLGCNIGGMFINVLAYADDLVLIAPSWRALQQLLDLLCIQIEKIDMECNTKKSLCMLFNPRDRNKVVSKNFPPFVIGNVQLQYVTEFRYLGHMISNDLTDDKDILREVRNMFYRTNLLVRRFSRCSADVKIVLFKAYCMCLYDSALWKAYNFTTINKLRSSYHRCIKIFFGFKRSDSVTNILCQLHLPSFATIIANGSAVFQRCFSSCANSLLSHLYTRGC